MRRIIAAALPLLLVPGALGGQSVLDRSPNVHGTWTLNRGNAAFVFAHRFELMQGGDELFNIPTLTLALGLPLGLTGGLDYTSYSEINPERPAGNETQYWLKRSVGVGPDGALAGLVAYNSAVKSWDAAVNVRQTFGPVGLYGELRGFSDRFGTGDAGTAGAVGASIRLTQHLAFSGDVGRVLDVDSLGPVWAAAVAMEIPGSPHTFSLQATNGGAITLQGASREKVYGREGKTRYGFVFTVPLGTGSRWVRIFRPASPAPPLPADTTVAERVEIRMIAYAPAEVRIRAGESVEWINRDPIEHTVTADDGSWDSGMMEEGARYVRRFTEPGRYSYHCTPHPQMTGVVVVEEP